MICRFHQTEDGASSGPPPAAPPLRAERPRLTILISSASFGNGPGSDWRMQSVADQLPQLLRPFGVRCLAACSGDETTRLIRSVTVHVAVVDLSIPLRPRPAQAGPGAEARNPEAGARVLQLLRRLEQPPPTIVVRPPQPSLRESGRTLAEALREGAFAVLDRPVHLETMLDALRRALRRHYSDHWPAA